MIYPWGTERRLNAYSDYFRKEFGGRVQKITIDAGFSCPNRDGNCGTGGCTFCNNKAFHPSYNDPSHPIRDQILQGMRFHQKRYRKARRYLAYFQAYSNTYAPLDELDRIYRQALEVPGIIGIVVGTRPDCVDEEKLDYFRDLSRDYYVVVEYGIESIHNETLRRVNRGHDVERTYWAVCETAARGVRVGGHLIIGLPGEDRSDFLAMADEISRWPLNNIKFHQLQFIRGTLMAREFESNPQDFIQYSLDEYLLLMLQIVEKLPPAMVIERIAGEVNPSLALQKNWGIRYDEVLRTFEKLLEEKNSWQGKAFSHDL